MVARLFEHWKFRISGSFVEFLDFPDDRAGEMKYLMRIDYFGGKFTIDLTQSDYIHLNSVVKPDVECRVFGDVIQSNGRPKLRQSSLEISGYTPNFKAISDEERLMGGFFEGCGELVLKREYSTKLGVRFQISVRSLGGVVELLIDESLYRKLPDKGLFLIAGRLNSSLDRSFSDGRVKFQSVLQYEPRTLDLCDVNGVLVANPAKKSA
jgi:hypothetical protein